MDTVITVSIDGDEAAIEKVEKVIRSSEKEFSVTDSEGWLYQLNRERRATFSSTGEALLRKALELCEYTNGYFDITVYPIVKAWGFTTGHYKVPEVEEIESLLSAVDYRKIKMDGEEIYLPDGMEIDLGGIAKGYIGDLCRDTLLASGVKSGILNFGGNVVAIGKKRNGEGWTVGIADPEDGLLGVYEASDCSVVTSGAYERYFEVDGKRYGHIINPYTGYPDSDLLSVTVIGKDGAKCDACSTALFAMGKEKAIAFCKKNDLDVILYGHDNIVYVGKNIAPSFTVDSRYRVEVIG